MVVEEKRASEVGTGCGAGRELKDNDENGGVGGLVGGSEVL